MSARIAFLEIMEFGYSCALIRTTTCRRLNCDLTGFRFYHKARSARLKALEAIHKSTNRDAARQELARLGQFIVIATRPGLSKRGGGFHLSWHQKPNLIDTWTVGVCIDGIRRNRVRPVVEVLEPDAAAHSNNHGGWPHTR